MGGIHAPSGQAAMQQADSNTAHYHDSETLYLMLVIEQVARFVLGGLGQGNEIREVIVKSLIFADGWAEMIDEVNSQRAALSYVRIVQISHQMATGVSRSFRGDLLGGRVERGFGKQGKTHLYVAHTTSAWGQMGATGVCHVFREEVMQLVPVLVIGHCMRLVMDLGLS